MFSKIYVQCVWWSILQWSGCLRLWHVMWLSLWLSENVMCCFLWICDYVTWFMSTGFLWIMLSEYACLIIIITMYYRTVYTCMNITVDSVSTGLCISLVFRLMSVWRPTVCFKDTVNKMKLGVTCIPTSNSHSQRTQGECSGQRIVLGWGCSP